MAWQRMPITTVTVAQSQLAGVLLRMQWVITMTYGGLAGNFLLVTVVSHLYVFGR